MKNFLRDIILFAALVLIYILGRLAILVFFGMDKLHLVTPEWALLSLRFDLMTAAYLTLPAAALSFAAMFFGDRRIFEVLKGVYFSFILALSLFFAITNVVFFAEYKSQFNQWILGIFYDDFSAIMMTIIKTYPIFLILLGIFAIVVFSHFATHYVFRKTSLMGVRRDWGARVAALAVCVPFFAFCMRGAAIEGDTLSSRETVVSDSAFLNNLVPNSAYCLRHELKTHFEFLSFDDSLDFFDTSRSEIKSLADTIFRGDFESLDSALEREASGSPLKTRPRHIFLIIAESHSAWPLYEKYRSRNLMPQTAKIAENSLRSSHALSAGICTVDSVTSILGGIPFAMLSAGCIEDYPADFSIASALSRLGYKSRFFVASSLDWCNIGKFTRRMGFAESLGGNAISDEFFQHEWGVPDREFFNYILGRDFDEPSFNVILTVSNHPPYDVDLKAEGCPNPIDSPLENCVQHMWYADSRIGDFVSRMRARHPDSLFIITGDHAARLNPPYLGEEFENRMCVPLIFAGKPIEEAGLARDAGPASHMDILPTLVELLADRGFKYKAWGDSLAAASRAAPPANPYAIYYRGRLYNPKIKSCPEEARKAMNGYIALAYWRAVKGPEFPQDCASESGGDAVSENPEPDGGR